MNEEKSVMRAPAQWIKERIQKGTLPGGTHMAIVRCFRDAGKIPVRHTRARVVRILFSLPKEPNDGYGVLGATVAYRREEV